MGLLPVFPILQVIFGLSQSRVMSKPSAALGAGRSRGFILKGYIEALPQPKCWMQNLGSEDPYFKWMQPRPQFKVFFLSISNQWGNKTGLCMPLIKMFYDGKKVALKLFPKASLVEFGSSQPGTAQMCQGTCIC